MAFPFALRSLQAQGRYRPLPKADPTRSPYTNSAARTFVTGTAAARRFGPILKTIPIMVCLQKTADPAARGSRGTPAAAARIDDAAPSRKATRSATLAAKPISCVTISMVMPSEARLRMTLQDFADEFGSSAEVGSSNSIRRGCMASARAMATRCCWPPDKWRDRPRPCREADARQHLVGAVVGLRRRQAPHAPQRLGNVSAAAQCARD